MTVYYRFSIVLLFLFCFGANAVSAQNERLSKEERVAIARESVQALQTGGLIIRVPTSARKIAALQAMVADESLRGPRLAAARQQLEQTIQETNERNTAMVRTLTEEYDLGPIYFLPDTAFSFPPYEHEGKFLDTNLVTNASILPPKQDFLVARIGYTDPSTTTRAEGFIFSNSNLEDLPSPFPGVIIFNNAGMALNKLLAPDIAERKRMEGASVRLVRKLRKAIAAYSE